MKRIGSGLWLMQRITYCNAVRRPVRLAAG